MSLLGSVLLYLVAPLTAVLAYLHHSAVKEEAEKKKNKFNADYKPEETDCTVELSFTRPGVDRVSLSLGLWFQVPVLTVVIRDCFRAGVHADPVDPQISDEADQSDHRSTW